MVVIFYSHFSFTFFASIILLLISHVKNCKGECQIPTETGFIEEDLNGLSQEDSGLIEAIKSRLISPSKNRYNFSKPDVNVQGQFDQAIILAELFGDKTDGFFIEARYFSFEYHQTKYLLQLFHCRLAFLKIIFF